LILSSGIQWLQEIFSPAELAKPHELLEQLKDNIPAWSFVGFLYYHASMVWYTRKAIQVDTGAS